ncbi:MAG: bifunctional demethylmenaquinone methyltransferase/2-methoxy-6-polyprenyl-1,4-benzoquinol methylase UbiE [Gammaproteobacteria bacterium]|jgi:demethylmenaquinone methyltransferase/2-methoxy-6-polyprenyl-1,4-benzoquinol methylase|nr:bifunctional demethylmenaquinone methyltransferase/2-methoxy-6-polyprenyl-1,4-benzoquinol methylase UbiE [Gammaproteobacteria bacterium]MDX2460159.1 bifunctional demethylmenaquinone methyltransferase/2-methoxy-6-polyprenyl-1,4-benzoquinol methylase UbiE [Gammaproteobacteria bacterium]
MNERTTNFGFEKVPVEDKARRVSSVFSSVAENYDLMNDLMSLGVHRLWKRFVIDLAGIRQGQRVLDLAGGTGDLTMQLLKKVGESGSVTLADISAPMLDVGRRRLVDSGILRGVSYVQANAETLPFAENSFDRVSIAFGLRNVTVKERALAAMLRVLRPGGQVLILEFSTLNVPLLAPLYRAYLMNVLPRMGQLVAGDSDSYRYLAESIRLHPSQEVLLEMMKAAGFERCSYHNLSGGIAAVHRGYKL